MTKKKPESLTKKQQEAIAKAEKEKAKKPATKAKKDKKPVEKSVKPVVKPKAKKEVEPKKVTKETKAPKKPAFDRDEVFPEVLEHDGETYERVDMSYDEIIEALEDGNEVFLAFEMTAESAKSYKNDYEVDPPKNGKKIEFPMGLDIRQVLIAQSKAMERLLLMSIMTDALMYVPKADFKKFHKDGYYTTWGSSKFNVYVAGDGEE